MEDEDYVIVVEIGQFVKKISTQADCPISALVDVAKKIKPDFGGSFALNKTKATEQFEQATGGKLIYFASIRRVFWEA